MYINRKLCLKRSKISWPLNLTETCTILHLWYTCEVMRINYCHSFGNHLERKIHHANCHLGPCCLLQNSLALVWWTKWYGNLWEFRLNQKKELLPAWATPVFYTKGKHTWFSLVSQVSIRASIHVGVLCESDWWWAEPTTWLQVQLKEKVWSLCLCLHLWLCLHLLN